jgi:RHH-type proline utilization regulon transcriptional repressor/proline dehydrogenase/delta 1-pyrroline-5-carboxylate dehydrogenase
LTAGTGTVGDHHQQDPPPPPGTESGTDADSLVTPAVELTKHWMAEGARSIRRAERDRAKRLHQLTADPESLSFAMAFCDRVLRPESARVAARQLRKIVRSGNPRFLGFADRLLVHAGATTSTVVPGVVMPLARRRLRALVGDLIADAADPGLARHLARLRSEGFRVNVNLLGEAVLGHAEAASRRAAVTALLERPDVDYVSVKVSSVCAQLNLWSYDESLERTKDALREVLAAAAAQDAGGGARGDGGTFVNFDMEEYRDLELTLDAFTALLDEPQFHGLHAGVALQAYLPDSMAALRRLAEWAASRRRRGGAPVRVRIVKGANLAMERVDAALHGWALAPYGTKSETDANHKAMIDYALLPEHTDALSVGVAGHNLFDLAWAHLLAESRHVSDAVSFELLQGMAPASARAVLATTGRVVLYTPVVAPRDFDHALAYLFRRLEENAGGDNFLATLGGSGLPARPGAFRAELDRFEAAVAQRRTVRTLPSRLGGANRWLAGFPNEPDIDPNYGQARAAVTAKLSAASVTPQARAPVPADLDKAGVDDVIVAATAGAHSWGRLAPRERADVLRRCGDALAARRNEFIALMAVEAKKTVTEADPEVSEVADFAHWYAEAAAELGGLDGAVTRPYGVVVVAGPWNFPLAIPLGGALAALAAGNAVVLKPAPQTPAVAYAAARACWDAGVPRDVLLFARCPDGPVGSHLIAHPGVGALVLTGSYETAELFVRLAPRTPLMAETSGKNAIVVMPEADLDQAATDLVRSAFSHSGQKCSAASLGILVGEVAVSERFRAQLVDAARSLELGPAILPGTAMGPLIETPSPKLQRALGTLEGRQHWLLEPKLVDAASNLWSPGIIEGVEPGDWFARTECFGPLLGLMAVRNLDEALAAQNVVPFGLTGGIWSLDPEDIRRWADRVEVGNAYINRHTTGAIVGRQPFGGYKRSVVGPGAKAGGPNYVLQLSAVLDHPNALPSRGAEPGPAVASLLGILTGVVGPLERMRLEAAARSDAYWWAETFGRELDEASLFCESNLLRYRPLDGLIIRVARGARVPQVARALLAATAVGAALVLSVPSQRGPVGLEPEFLRSLDDHGRLQFVQEETDALIARLQALDASAVARVRLLGDEPELRALEPRFHVDARPPILLGRVELLRYLREQTVSQTRHRFGNVVASPDG